MSCAEGMRARSLDLVRRRVRVEVGERERERSSRGSEQKSRVPEGVQEERRGRGPWQELLQLKRVLILFWLQVRLVKKAALSLPARSHAQLFQRPPSPTLSLSCTPLSPILFCSRRWVCMSVFMFGVQVCNSLVLTTLLPFPPYVFYLLGISVLSPVELPIVNSPLLVIE